MDDPLVSFILITYNQEKCVREAVESALNQDYGNLEIIISDDNSNDQTSQIIENAIRCAHRKNVRLIKNTENRGVTGNISKAIAYAHGELFCLAAGDDISEWNRVSRTVAVWNRYGRPAAVGSALRVIDNAGCCLPNHKRAVQFDFTSLKFLHGAKFIARHYVGDGGISILGATLSYHRSVFDKFGWDLEDCDNEDMILLGRAALLGGALAIPEKLVRHRITGLNLSIRHDQTVSSRKKAIVSRQKKLNMYRNVEHDLNLALNSGMIDEDLYGYLRGNMEPKIETLCEQQKIAVGGLVQSLVYSISANGAREGLHRFAAIRIPKIYHLYSSMRATFS